MRYDLKQYREIPSIRGKDLDVSYDELRDWDRGFLERLRVQEQVDHPAFICSRGLTEQSYQDGLNKLGVVYTERTIPNIFCGERFNEPEEIQYISPKDGRPKWAYQFTFGSIDSYSCDVLILSSPVPDEEIGGLFDNWRSAFQRSMREQDQLRKKAELGRPFWAMINGSWMLGEFCFELRLFPMSDDEIADRLNWGATACGRDGFISSIRKYAELCPETLLEKAHSLGW